MAEPIPLSGFQKAKPENLPPSNYWDLDALASIESAHITANLLPQRAADAARTMSPAMSEAEFVAYAGTHWTQLKNDLATYSPAGERDEVRVLDKAKIKAFEREAPSASAVTRMLVLFWLAAGCEAGVFVLQGMFSGGFNPFILLLAAILAFGGFLFGSGIGKMHHNKWSVSFLQEPRPLAASDWFQVVLGAVLIFAVSGFRAFGAGELIPGVMAFLITMLLGALCALFEMLHQSLKLKRQTCLEHQALAQRWTANTTHAARMLTYKQIFEDQLRMRSRPGGNIVAPVAQAAHLHPLIQAEGKTSGDPGAAGETNRSDPSLVSMPEARREVE